MKYCFSKDFLKTFHVFNSSSKNESTSRKSLKSNSKNSSKCKKKQKSFDRNNELREKQKILVLELKNKSTTEAQNKLQVIRLTKNFNESIFRSDNIKI